LNLQIIQTLSQTSIRNVLLYPGQKEVQGWNKQLRLHWTVCTCLTYYIVSY